MISFLDIRRAGIIHFLALPWVESAHALCLLSIGVAGYAVIVYGFLPPGALVHPDMRASFEAYKLGIYAHNFGSAIALFIGPFQFLSRLRARYPALHRWFGRLYMGAGVLVGGLAGLFMAGHASGGLIAHTGFAAPAFCWLYAGLRAYLAI